MYQPGCSITPKLTPPFTFQHTSPHQNCPSGSSSQPIAVEAKHPVSSIIQNYSDSLNSYLMC
jgi:hypothetical protein